MPRKSWEQKSQFKADAKRPDEVYFAIRKLFCFGKTQTATCKIIGRWSKIYNKKSVSRVTVNRHYQEIEHALWYIYFYHIYAVKPYPLFTPKDEFEMNSIVRFVNISTSDYEAVKRRYGDSKEIPNCIPKPGDLFNNVAIDELNLISRGAKGISKKTIYAQWLRGICMEIIGIDNPHMSLREIKLELYRILISWKEIYEKDERAFFEGGQSKVALFKSPAETVIMLFTESCVEEFYIFEELSSPLRELGKAIDKVNLGKYGHLKIRNIVYQLVFN